ncbi:MAG: T9SS C-terminal target domain-containing protein [Flavobacteriales bacterium]|nr:T9SS C-terminal target domain-containing protein [Flavobacteriales bacterium]
MGRNNDNAYKGPSSPTTAAGCTPATTATDLEINNIKLLVQTGGDMWWDLTNPKFEVPKGSGRHSMFAGALWIGGKDVSGQLKVAAQRYRAGGNVDYWTGPLSTELFDIDPATCAGYDRHFASNRIDISRFDKWYKATIADAENGTNTVADDFPDYVRPTIIDEWPAHGRNFDPYNEAFYLAPFYDRNGDGVYSPNEGDYPGYELNTSETDCGERRTSIYGDANLWWVFNDKGNVHTESGSNSIGMEIRAQAFSLATNDEVNNMTFCNYELVNRSSFTLTETYFGVFCDPDLGGANDDYVGCDVEKGLGYCYNGDDNDLDDGGASGYGTTPPAIGIDFFEGPYQDSDGIDNALGIGEGEALNGVGYGDSLADNGRYGMRRFVWFNRDGASCCTDPSQGTEYYQYLRSFWKDGTRMVYGGTGHQNSGGTIEADFMFPGNSDPLHWGTKGIDPGYTDPRGWTEAAEANTPADRRFIQSAGPFTLLPGAVNDITIGIVWARSATGGAQGSVDAMIAADEKTQALFDNCFRLLSGPNAPVLTAQELENEIILYINNPISSNNYQEGYSEIDAFIIAPDSIDTNDDDVVDYAMTQFDKDEFRSYKFQGYKIYQVKDGTVDASSLGDIEKARLIYQGDIRDDISKLYNYKLNKESGFTDVTEEVDGNNKGILHSIQIVEDLFATGDRKLINHKTYYFIGISYAFNNHTDYDPNDESSQKTTYIGSTKSPTGGINAIATIPHNPSPENGGTVINSSYGQTLSLTRIEGSGNGGLTIDLKQESKDSIMAGSPWIVQHPVYEANGSPLTVKIVDPLNVKGGNFTIEFKDSTENISVGQNNTIDDSYYVVYETDVPDTLIFSTRNIEVGNEELLLDWGISIYAEQAELPSQSTDGTFGLLSGTLTFDDESKPWLLGINDVDGDSLFDWISVGVTADDMVGYEDFAPYENILDGSWAPSRLCASELWGPLPDDLTQASGAFYPMALDAIYDDLSNLSSVDIVFTSDKSMWTRCPVIEIGANPTSTKGEIGVGPFETISGSEVAGALKGRLRQSPSVDKDGISSGWPSDNSSSTSEGDPNYIAAYGMGWFPGYAINIETGERLNMAFGENSDKAFSNDNGDDMIWNPSSRVDDGGPFAGPRLGGMHYIYVFRNNVVRQNESTTIIGFTYQFYNDESERMPAYDNGQYAFDNLSASSPSTGPTDYDNSAINVYGASMWVGFPLLNPDNYSLLQTDATVKLRVRKPFSTLGTNSSIDLNEALTIGESYWVDNGPIIHKGDTLYHGESFVADTTLIEAIGTSTTGLVTSVVNNGLPMYTYSTEGFASIKGSDSEAISALDLISIVPNPYYAYSQYETNRLDNRVKIVNLPDQCTITIYSINGTLIRQYSKDDATQTYIDWDLKNTAFIPIASGVYIVHVEVPEVGEVVLKWFGAMRPVDLDSF